MTLLQVLTKTSHFSRKILGCSNKSNPFSRHYCKVLNRQLFRTAIMASQNKPVSHVRFHGLDGPAPSKIPVSSDSTVRTLQLQRSCNEIDKTDPVELAKSIFLQGLQNVIPSRLILSKVKVHGTQLTFENDSNTTIDLKNYDKKYVIGFGKGCLPMAETLQELLQNHIDRCIVSVPFGSRKCKSSSIEVHCGAKDNIPDEAAFSASKVIVDLVKSCKENDLLFVLISGGGSALLPYPIPPITLEEKTELIKKLSKAGCTINEMNVVRRRLSLVKGGGLVEMSKAGKIISLIISDVSGSPLQVIASGPTVENYDLPNAAMNIIDKYGLERELPESIQGVLSHPPVNLLHKENFKNVTNFIIGDNKLALESAAEAAKKYGLSPFIVTTAMFGEASTVGYDMANIAETLAFYINRPLNQNQGEDVASQSYLESIKRTFKQNKWSTENILPEIFEEYDKASKGVCLLFGGETTVTVTGSGKGGRNQELALSAGVKLDLCRNIPHVKDRIAILSAGTDGIDGPNSAAGAVVESSTMHNSQLQGLSPVNALKENDSFNFFHQAMQGKYHIICGHTETNVMDLVIVVILKKSVKRESKRRSML